MQWEAETMKVAVFVMGAKSSLRQSEAFVRSAEHYFLPGAQRYYVNCMGQELRTDLVSGSTLTNRENQESVQFSSDERKKLGISELRRTNDYELSRFDYVFSICASMTFRRCVEIDFLPDRPDRLVVVQHPKFVNIPPDRLPFDRSTNSVARVASAEGIYYVTCQIFGGTPEVFSDMWKFIDLAYAKDSQNAVRARYGFNSYLNRYIVDHPYTLRHAGYCYPRGWDLGVPRVIESSLVDQPDIIQQWRTLEPWMPGSRRTQAA